MNDTSLARDGEVMLPQQSPVRVQRWVDGEVAQIVDQVAEEQPVALLYQGIPHVVMLATPADLADLGVGFTVSEGIVRHSREIHSVEVFNAAGTLEIRMGIATECFAALLRQHRNLTGRTGCGVCGAERIEQVIRHPVAVGEGVKVSAGELHEMLAELPARQCLNARTGGVHAAAWVLPGRGIQLLREDVGRHNALDKVLGALLRMGVDPAAGYLIITSRASYEMVQKAATVGITVLAAVSAPTRLAIQLAEQSNLTLIGFARARQHVVYTHTQRLMA